MPSLELEVFSLFDSPRSVDELLYLPTDSLATYRQTRRYILQFLEEDIEKVKCFALETLIDKKIQKEKWDGESDCEYESSDFLLEYGIKEGVMDLECEAFLKFCAKSQKSVLLEDLKISHRFYIFNAEESLRNILVEDICNPLIHQWKIIS